MYIVTRRICYSPLSSSFSTTQKSWSLNSQFLKGWKCCQNEKVTIIPSHIKLQRARIYLDLPTLRKTFEVHPTRCCATFLEFRTTPQCIRRCLYALPAEAQSRIPRPSSPPRTLDSCIVHSHSRTDTPCINSAISLGQAQKLVTERGKQATTSGSEHNRTL
jgi:hypothetical protein